MNQGYKTEKLFIALNKLAQDQSLHLHSLLIEPLSHVTSQGCPRLEVVCTSPCHYWVWGGWLWSLWPLWCLAPNTWVPCQVSWLDPIQPNDQKTVWAPVRVHRVWTAVLCKPGPQSMFSLSNVGGVTWLISRTTTWKMVHWPVTSSLLVNQLHSGDQCPMVRTEIWQI